MWQGHLGDHKVKDGEEVVGAEMQVGAAVGDAERLHPPMERPPIQKVPFPLEHNKAKGAIAAQPCESSLAALSPVL